MSDPAESGHDLIGDEQDIVFVANFPDAGEIVFWRYVNPAGAHDRFGPEGRHGVLPELQYFLLKLLDQEACKFLFAHAVADAIGVRCRHVMNIVGLIFEIRIAVRFFAAQACRDIGRTVIGLFARDDMALFRLAAIALIILYQTISGIIGGRTAARKHDMTEIAGRQLGQFGRQFRRRHVCRIHKRIEKRHFARLIGNCLYNLFASIADIDAPQPANAIQIALAIDIGDIGALGFVHNQRACLVEGFKMGPGMNEMLAILVPDILCEVVVKIGIHDVTCW